MKTYTYTSADETGIRVEDTETGMVLFVPTDPANRDYAEIIDQGIEIAAYVVPPPPIPTSVTPLQIRKAIRISGLKSQVDAYISALDEEVVEAWEYATMIERNNTFVLGAQEAFSMSDQQVDDLFVLASQQ